MVRFYVNDCFVLKPYVQSKDPSEDCSFFSFSNCIRIFTQIYLNTYLLIFTKNLKSLGGGIFMLRQLAFGTFQMS